MADLTAQRTLVKSPPELWSELSEVESLARHLGELGDIRITRVEPESTVAWEGEQISGTVELEQSGWGTKVTFRATVPEPDPAPEPEAIAEPRSKPELAEPIAVVEPLSADPTPVDPEPVPSADLVAPEPAEAAGPEPEPRRTGFWARWLFRQRRPATVEPEPAPEPVAAVREPATVEIEAIVVEPEPEPVTVEPAPVAAEPEPSTEPPPAVAAHEPARVQAVLDGTLEALGQAHHRPFSRG